MKKRVLALLICACMLIGMVPVFANEIAESGSTSSSSMEGTTSSAETGSTEGTGDASEPPVDNGDASEPPVDNGDTSEPPVDNGDTSEPPVDNGDTSEPPVDNGDTSEPPVDTGDASEPPVDTGDTSEPPVDTGDTSEPPVDPEQPVGPEHPIVVPPENLLPSIPEFPNPFPPIELECTCGAAEGEEHAEGCPLYVKPEFDVETAYEYLMNCETTAEMESYRDEYLTEDMIAQFSDEQVDEIEAHYAELMDLELMEEEVEAAVNYDNVAEFAQAISDSPVRRKAPSKAFLLSVPETDQVTPTDVDDNNGLELSKTAEETDNGYQLKLEAYTTGKVQAGTAKPSDVILVLDLSTSMKSNFSGRLTRLEAMKQAATSFIDNVADKATEDRIAIVGFGQQARYMSGSNAGNSLLDATDNANSLKSTISNISAGGGFWGGNGDLESATEHGRGMEYAVNIFNAQTNVDYTNRNKIVILFTDGEPAPQNTDSWSSRVVKQAIENSYKLKSEHNAAVYTVSVMPGTNASNPTSDMDKYMDYISSDYPDARYLGNSIDDKNTRGDSYYSGRTSNIIAQITPGDKADTSNGSFYLTAGDIDTLESIFGQISDQTGGASIALDAETVISDVISDYFELPQGADENSITVDTQDAVYNGSALSWTTTTIQDFDPAVTINGKTIAVEGFDFNRNFVAEKGRTEGDVSQEGDFHGRKLIITIPVVVRDGFWGGNQVPTNGNASAVYDKNGNLVETFEVPDVDVPINIPAPGTTDLNVYYNGADVPGVNDLNDGITLPTGENAWQDDYINTNTIAYSMNGTVSMTQDGTYTITATAQPLYSGTYTEGTSTATAEVDVFTPTADFHDSVLYLMQTPVYADQNLGTLTWKHGDVTSDTVNMFGREPAQTYTYDVTPNPLTENSTVQPTLSLNGTEYGETETFTVHVKKPTVKWTDTSCYYGAIIPTSFAPVGDVIWALADGDTVPQDAYIEATAPGLSYTFDVASNTLMPKEIVDVNAEVTIFGQDATRFVTFTWEKNSEVCSADCTAKPGDAEFRIHPKFCTLTIDKTISGTVDDEQDSFIFTVNGTGNKYAENVKDMKVTVLKDGQVTISGLPVGTYTVTEDTNWSWRYTTDDATDTATLSSSNVNGTTAITNTLHNEKWLSGSSIAENTWSADNTQVKRTKGPNGFIEKIRKLFG